MSIRTASVLCKSIVLAALGTTALPSLADCIQDQYGNQFNLTYDTVHGSITGTATMTQCGGDVWPVLGSFAGANFARRNQTLVFANSTGTASCTFGPFMLKGKYPKFAWYYTTGYGAQESSFVACAIQPVEVSGAGKGAQR